MERYFRVKSGKRAGEIVRYIREEGYWVIVETADIGEHNYPQGVLEEVDSSLVQDLFVPYFGKSVWAGWTIPGEA